MDCRVNPGNDGGSIGANQDKAGVRRTSISALRAGGEHEGAQPLHRGKAEDGAVDEVVDRQDELRAARGDGSGKWCTTPLNSTPSKLAAGNGRCSMSPATNSICGCLRRPISSNFALMSTPTQL